MPRLITSTPAARFSAILRSSWAKAYGGMRSRRLLGFMQLLFEVLAETPLEHRPRPARQLDPQILAHLDLELTAVEQHGDRGIAAISAVLLHVGHRRPCRPGPGRQGLPHSALEDACADAPLAHRRVPRYVRAVGEELVSFDPGAESRQVQRLQLAEGVDTNRALGVADRDVLEDPLAPIGAQHSAPVAGTVRVVARAQARAAHVDGA